jgi:D-3-phosphoglycerate dehydrogenase
VTSAAQKGVLEVVLTEELNIVNAPVMMRRHGITVTVAKTSEVRGYTELVTIAVLTDRGSYQVAGTVFPEPACRILGIDEYRMEAPLQGRMLLISNSDRPGVIGFIGTTLGSHQVNIADMHLSRIRSRGTAICLVTVDTQMPPAAVQALRGFANIIRVALVEVEEARKGPPSLPPIPPAFSLDTISEI